MNTTSSSLKAFIRIINIPQGKDGVAVTVNTLESKDSQVSIHLQGEFHLERVFHNKRPHKALEAAEKLATSLPPRTTTHCLIYEYGFLSAEDLNPEEEAKIENLLA